jgi:mRNA-degrading endonuclease RelE of RelBE toxin-antitoxin system
MNPAWQLVIHEQAWDFSERLRSYEKEQLRRGLRSLANDPGQKVDAIRRSPAGREYSVKYFGRIRVVYWLDSFVREVRIVEIDRILTR